MPIVVDLAPGDERESREDLRLYLEGDRLGGEDVVYAEAMDDSCRLSAAGDSAVTVRVHVRDASSMQA